MPGVSLEQLSRPIQILKLVRKLHMTGMFFQTLMKMGPGTPPDIVTDNRTFGYDTYASTRPMAPVTAPMAPPPSMGLKPFGQNSATLVRTHGSISIYDEKVFMTRAPGGRLSEVDSSGQRYVAMQMDHLVTSFRNNREFMISRMLRGGFGLERTGGDQFRLVEKNDTAAQMTVDYQIPAENLADLDGIIGAGESWNLTGAPIPTHLMDLSKRMARTSGYSPRHIIMNSSTFTPLLYNTVLQKAGGDAYRIWDAFTQKELNPQDPRSSVVYTVQFRAKPMFLFHVINEGLILDEVVPNEANQIDADLFKLFVPDGKAIIIPKVDSRWAGYAAGREPVRERTDQMNPSIVTGFGVWRTPEINPSRYDITAVDNGVPLLYIPRVVHFADVWEPYTSSEA